MSAVLITRAGIAVDKAGNVYVGTNHEVGIVVFSPDGKLLRTMAPAFAGTHSLLVREEGGVEFLYGVHLRRTRAFKMTLDGHPIMILPFSKASGAYGPTNEGYKPSAVAPDGSIFVGDTYGTSLIHKYNAAGAYLLSFGGRGEEEGKFLNCQGLTIDTRLGRPRRRRRRRETARGDQRRVHEILPLRSLRHGHFRDHCEHRVHFHNHLHHLLILLVLPPALHHLAQAARMLAVESFLDRDDQRLPARVAREHPDPRDRLQRQPVPAEHTAKKTMSLARRLVTGWLG